MTRPEPDSEALAGAAGAVRRLITHLRKTTADAGLLGEVERQANALAEKLAPFDHEGPYMQRALLLPEGPDSAAFPDTRLASEFFPYSPIVGPLNPISGPIEFHLEGREFRARHAFEPQFNGPPGSVHGGVIAMVFDELLGCLGGMLGIGGFTGTLTVVYRSLTPLQRPIDMRSWVDREEGVKTFVKGTMHTTDADGTERLCAEAEGIFIRPKQTIFEDAITKSRERLEG